MRQFPGLWGQQLAGPLPFPRSIAMLPLAGPNPYKGLEVGRSIANLSASSQAAVISTPWFDLVPTLLKRDNLFETKWRQLSGPAGAVETDGPLRARFTHNIAAVSANPISWSCDLVDKYGKLAAHRADFTLTRTEPPPPPLTAYGNPGSNQLVPIDPATRRATVNFSATVTSAVFPVSYDWGGGDNRYGAYNSVTIELPVGATEGINFSPGCTITDDLGRTIVVSAGPFFIYEP